VICMLGPLGQAALDHVLDILWFGPEDLRQEPLAIRSSIRMPLETIFGAALLSASLKAIQA